MSNLTSICLSPVVLMIVYIIIVRIIVIIEKKKQQEYIKNYIPPKGTKKGKVIGYKKLVKLYGGTYTSPLYRNFKWQFDKWNYADAIPEPNNTNGIYITKNKNDYRLNGYEGVVVQIVGDGWYVEHEDGYRLFKAGISKEIG